jgi:hypothetical protein
MERASLIAVWLGTAIVSTWTADDLGRELLRRGAVPEAWQPLLIGSGVVVDAAIGLALWFAPSRTVYALALAMMGLMTLVATVIDPALWLHSLGPLLKNLPIAALLWQQLMPLESNQDPR